jgi:hypothetical protein
MRSKKSLVPKARLFDLRCFLLGGGDVVVIVVGVDCDASIIWFLSSEEAADIEDEEGVIDATFSLFSSSV